MRSIARSLVLVTGSRLLDGAVRFFTVPVVLGYFGRADFGLLALAFSIHVFLTIADFGVSVNAVRRFTEQIQQGQTRQLADLVHAASFFYAAIGVFNLVAMAVVGLNAQAWFGLDARQAADFQVMTLCLGVSSAITWAFAIYRQVLLASGQVGWDEGVNVLSSLLTLAVVAAAVVGQFSLTLYFGLVLLPPLVPMVLRVRRALRSVPGLRLGMKADWPIFQPLVSTSLWLFLLSLAEMLANHYRPIILAQQSGLETVADFRIIQQVAGFATLLLAGSLNVLYPAVARLDAAQDEARLQGALTHGTRLLLWAHLGLLVPLAFLAGPMLQLYVGHSFTHLHLELGVWLLTLVAFHNTVISSVVLARGRLSLLAVCTCANALLTLLLGWMLSARFGVAAMVWTYALYTALQLAVVYLLVLPTAGGGSGLALIVRVWPRPLLCALGAAVLAWWLVGTWGGSVGWVGLAFVPLFLAAAALPGGVRRDWQLLRRPA